MQTRLHSKYPDLAQAILEASLETRRRVVRAAGVIAAERAELDQVLRGNVIASVNGAKPLDGEARASLEKLQQEADDRYLDVLDSLAADEPPPAEAMKSFMRARAVAAILGAVANEGDPAAATEVVYEALACASDDTEVLATVRRILP